MSDARLLPPNATLLERNVAAACAEAATLPVTLRDLWDPESCPAAMLPWLAWAWSVDTWQDQWTERQKRDTVKAALAVQQIKGTAGAVRQALDAMGIPVRVQEWFNQTPAAAPYTFRLLVDVDQIAVTQAGLVAALEAVERTKSLRSHLDEIAVSAVTRSRLTVAAACNSGHEVGVSYDAPRYSDGAIAWDLMTDAAYNGEPSTVGAIDSLHALLHTTMTKQYW